jgi:capsular polysaccharide biosynthesis protein
MIYIPPVLENLSTLAKHLFGESLINTNSLDQTKLHHFNELILIKNHTDMKYFFTYNDTDFKHTLREYYNDNNIVSLNNVFLTRSINSDHDRYSVLDNLAEVETFFKLQGFHIVDPSKTTDKYLYNVIKQTKNLIVSNGSTLTSLIILESHSKVFCLNARRYLPDWRKDCKNAEEEARIIKIDPSVITDNFEKNLWRPTTKNFDFIYIDSFLNKITNVQLEYIIANLA